MPTLQQYLRLVEASESLQPVTATVFHGSPTSGIKAFDPTKRGSNTGDRDARRGFFFFGTKRAAEGYLDRDEGLKPEIAEKVALWTRQVEEHNAAWQGAVRDALAQHGLAAPADFDSLTWLYKLPQDARDEVRRFLDGDRDKAMASHLQSAIHGVWDRSENLTQVLHGSVYECRVTLRAAYVTDMNGAAYSADAYSRIINFAETNYQPDGMVLTNVLDSEVGLRDTVTIAFEADQIEIVGEEPYDGVPVAYRSY